LRSPPENDAAEKKGSTGRERERGQEGGGADLKQIDQEKDEGTTHRESTSSIGPR